MPIFRLTPSCINHAHAAIWWTQPHKTRQWVFILRHHQSFVASKSMFNLPNALWLDILRLSFGLRLNVSMQEEQQDVFRRLNKLFIIWGLKVHCWSLQGFKATTPERRMQYLLKVPGHRSEARSQLICTGLRRIISVHASRSLSTHAFVGCTIDWVRGVSSVFAEWLKPAPWIDTRFERVKAGILRSSNRSLHSETETKPFTLPVSFIFESPEFLITVSGPVYQVHDR